MRETLNREIDQSSTEIAGSLEDYFQDRGWKVFAAPVHSALGSYALPPPPMHLETATSVRS
jgi:hypothetical protein